MTVAADRPVHGPPHDLDAERAVLGALLLTPAALTAVTDTGLRPEHFYRRRHQHIYTAMTALADNGVGLDVITVCDHLRDGGLLDEVGGELAVDDLAADLPEAGNAHHYAAIVVDLAAWRERLTAALSMQAAVQARDVDAFADAEARLARPNRAGRQRTLSPSQVAEAAWERMQSTERPERFPWPFRKLNQLSGDGAARGQVTVIAGPTSHGKSVFVDQALESGAAAQHVDAHLFLNEMTEEERTARTLGRLAGVPWRAVFDRRLDDKQAAKVLDALNRVRFGITECAGWTAGEICRQARRRGHDLVAVDLVNKLPHRGPSRAQDLADASTQFNALAKDTGCHVLLVAHLNRARVGMDGRRPVPTVTDIKDAQALIDDADNALYVWREQDADTGDPLPEGTVRFAKARGGELGGLPVRFDGELMRFDPQMGGTTA